MLNRLIFLGIAMLSILVFQNCAQNPSATLGESQAKQTMSTKTFIFQDDYDRIGGAGLGNLSLDVKTGVIDFAASDSASGVHAALSPSATRYCLDEDERSELEALLLKDKVCSFKNQNPSDTVCSSIYRPAYAQYGSQTQSLVSVGEAVSGCDVVADFCSGNGDRIRQIIEIVKASLDSRICSTEY